MSDRPFLTAEWRNLVFLNYVVDPQLLAALVPAGTALDSHAGHTYMSLVAFEFRDTRVLGVRIPWHHTFEELNLRFYVRREVAGEVRRGVVFIREVVPRRAIAMVARWLYNEPYVALPMRHRVIADSPQCAYSWRHQRAWRTIAARGQGAGAITAPGSHEAFIVEHEWGYTRQRDGSTLEYRVEHPRWHVWPAQLTERPAGLEALYGADLARALGEPASALIADGSPVTVFRGRRLDG